MSKRRNHHNGTLTTLRPERWRQLAHDLIVGAESIEAGDEPEPVEARIRELCSREALALSPERMPGVRGAKQ